MNILYLVPHVPNETKVRSHFQIQGLIEAGHRVTVATLKRTSQDDQHISKLQHRGCHVLWVPFSKPLAALNATVSLAAGRPMQARLMWSEELMRSVEIYLRSNPPDIIHVEHLRMAEYGLRLASKWPVVWDAVDHLTSLYSQAAATSVSIFWKIVAAVEAPRLKSYEHW